MWGCLVIIMALGLSQHCTSFAPRPLVSAPPRSPAHFYSPNDIEGMRAGEIKAILTGKGVSTRGLLDKSDLAAKLLEVSRAEAAPSLKKGQGDEGMTEIPMFDVSFFAPGSQNSISPGASKSYLAVDLDIKGRTYRMILDSAASMNIITNRVVAEAGLFGTAVDSTTIGMGGSGSLFSKMCRLEEGAALKSAAGQGTVRTRELQFAILDNPAAIPPTADGLLGLPFFAALPKSLVEIDFSRGVLRCGMDSLPRKTDPNASRLSATPLQRIFTGLRICTALCDNRVPVAALLDLGSAYTILNPAAAMAITGLTSLDQLPLSGLRVAGIDGRPVELRLVNLGDGGVSLGGQGTSRSGFRVPGPLSVYAGDIPGFGSIGLGPAVPAALVGMDVLGRTGEKSKPGSGGQGPGMKKGRLAFDLVGDWMYLEV